MFFNFRSINGVDEVPLQEEALMTGEYDSIDYSEISKHGKKYTSLLKVYINTTRINLYVIIFLKIVFFIITMYIWLYMIHLFKYSYINAMEIISSESKNLYQINTTINLVVTIIPSLVSLLTSFIVIPKIVAKYLFNRSEEDNMTQVIKNLQSYDDELNKNRYKELELKNEINKNRYKEMKLENEVNENRYKETEEHSNNKEIKKTEDVAI